MKVIILSLILFVSLMSCSHKNTDAVGKNDIDMEAPVVAGFSQNSKIKVKIEDRKRSKVSGDEINMIPDATAFRMSGDYQNNVAVTLSPDGKLIYYPDPSDITADSKPIQLVGGWWLNCQGIGPNSVFTKYTFAEYASLPQAPSPEQIKLDIIPGARVTGFIELPMKIGEAVQNIDEVNSYLEKQEK